MKNDFLFHSSPIFFSFHAFRLVFFPLFANDNNEKGGWARQIEQMRLNSNIHIDGKFTLGNSCAKTKKCKLFWWSFFKSRFLDWQFLLCSHLFFCFPLQKKIYRLIKRNKEDRKTRIFHTWFVVSSSTFTSPSQTQIEVNSTSFFFSFSHRLIISSFPR